MARDNLRAAKVHHTFQVLGPTLDPNQQNHIHWKKHPALKVDWAVLQLANETSITWHFRAFNHKHTEPLLSTGAGLHLWTVAGNFQHAPPPQLLACSFPVLFNQLPKSSFLQKSTLTGHLIMTCPDQEGTSPPKTEKLCATDCTFQGSCGWGPWFVFMGVNIVSLV